MPVTFMIALAQEADGRWTAGVVQLPGVLVHGATETEAGTPLDSPHRAAGTSVFLAARLSRSARCPVAWHLRGRPSWP
jgi:hypothetical protein